MSDLTLRIITPERIVLDAPARQVKFPALDGSMGVLPRHAAMVAALDAGSLSWTSLDGEVGHMFVSGGFAEVRANTVRVVTEASEPAGEIDVQRATESARRARERLQQRHVEGGELDLLRAEASLRRALMRISVANRGQQ